MSTRPRLTKPFTKTKGRRLGARPDERDEEDDAEQGLVLEAEKFDEELRKVRKLQKVNAKRAASRGSANPSDGAKNGGDNNDNNGAQALGEDGEGDEDEQEARAWAQIQAEREAEQSGEGKEKRVSRRLAAKARILDGPALEAHAAELHLEDFAESLTVVAGDAEGTSPVVEDPDDDSKREVAFVAAALRAVKQARAQLDTLKVPHYRPNDYMATMLKSDEHMARVKRRLLKEQKAMQVVEMRKQAKKYKVRAKQVQQSKDKEKADRKKKAGELAAEYRSTVDARADRVGSGEHEGADFARDKRKRPFGRSSGGKSGGGSGGGGDYKRGKSAVSARPGKSKRASFKSGKSKGGSRR